MENNTYCLMRLEAGVSSTIVRTMREKEHERERGHS